jgi:hypothetical protein
VCYLLLQKRKECRKFQHAIPTYIEQLAEMFHGIVVYGSSSCIPGDVHRVYEEQEEDGDGEDLLNSSTPSSRGKRSFTSTSRSPPKKRKSPVVKMFNGLISEMQLSRNADTDVFNQLKTIQENKSLQAIDQFNSCLDLAVESGADKESDEYFVATKLFKDEYNRAIFNRFDTATQRMKWLQRFCKEYFG